MESHLLTACTNLDFDVEGARHCPAWRGLYMPGTRGRVEVL